ncbi:MAG: glutathione S-transferase family protein [Salinarimonas sp.]
MMILRTSPPSPFGRKVKIAASVLGLSDQLKVEGADTADPGDSLRKQNPLGKIPVLIEDDGTTWYDSRVIVEYLDHLAGGGKLLPQGAARLPVLRLQALADGLVDANILILYEGRWRDPAHHEAKWLEYQQGKVTRALDALAEQAPDFTGKVDVGTISVACALGHMDLRFEGAYRKSHPALDTFMNRFAADVPAFEATKVTA